MRLLISALFLAGSVMSCERTPSSAQQASSAPDARASSTTQRTPATSSPSGPVRFSDAHVHLNPAAYATFLDLADDIGLVRSANLSGGSGPDAFQAHRQLSSSVGDRIAPFMNVDWSGVDEPDFGRQRAADLERAVASGYAGLKISKALGLGVKIGDAYMEVDDPRLAPLFDKAGELGVPVAIHTADPKAFFEPPGPENERFAELSQAPSWSFHGDEFPSRDALLAARDRVVARHPDTTFILVHFANNPEDIDYVDALLDAHPNVLVDISARVGEIGRHDPERVRHIFTKHAGRILFATDLQYVVGRQRGQLAYRLTLGSISREPPRLEDVERFYRQHAMWLEGSGEPIEHPVPIQGDWKVSPIDLDDETLTQIYWRNAEERVFAPWLGRKRAHELVRGAETLASPHETSQ